MFQELRTAMPNSRYEVATVGWLNLLQDASLSSDHNKALMVQLKQKSHNPLRPVWSGHGESVKITTAVLQSSPGNYPATPSSSHQAGKDLLAGQHAAAGCIAFLRDSLFPTTLTLPTATSLSNRVSDFAAVEFGCPHGYTLPGVVTCLWIYRRWGGMYATLQCNGRVVSHHACWRRWPRQAEPQAAASGTLRKVSKAKMAPHGAHSGRAIYDGQ